MSKLGDRIRRSGKVEPAPLGFAPASRTASVSMLVVADVGNDAGKIADAVKKGADVVTWEGDAAALRKAKLPDGLILGVKASGAGREEAAALREAGADFLIVDTDSRGEALLDEKLGFVMSIDDSSQLEDNRLRLMGELSLDALLIDSPGAPLSVSDVMELRRLAALTRVPLLVRLDPAIDAGALQLLRESGAIGVVADSAGKLTDLRKTVESLPDRGRKRDDKSDALVPASTSAGSHDHDDDDFDD